MKYACLGFAFAVLIVGCTPMGSSAKADFKSGAGTDLRAAQVTLENLRPEASPGTKGQLVLGGLQVPIGIVRSVVGNLMTLDLRAHDESFETETYEFDKSQFALTQASEESFTPPLPLLKFPMKVGDAWTWKGSIKSGAERPAEASISTRPDKVYLAGGQQEDALMAEVKLTMDSGTRTPAERRLAFWFVKNKGVVKREIGSGSTRLPAAP